MGTFLADRAASLHERIVASQRKRRSPVLGASSRCSATCKLLELRVFFDMNLLLATTLFREKSWSGSLA